MIHYTQQRKAFSMITAIFMILLLATVASFILNLSGKVVEETTAQYRKEQAILYAKSYTEFAIMAASSQNCIKTINANIDGDTNQVKAGEGYRVNVHIQYIGNDLITAGIANCKTLGGAITYNNSKGAIVLIDVYVRYRNPDYDNAINNVSWNDNNQSGITYHRRTLQRL